MKHNHEKLENRRSTEDRLFWAMMIGLFVLIAAVIAWLKLYGSADPASWNPN